MREQTAILWLQETFHHLEAVSLAAAGPWGPGLWLALQGVAFFVFPDGALVLYGLQGLGHASQGPIVLGGLVLLATVASLLGGVLDYALGRWGGQALGQRWKAPRVFSAVQGFGQRYGALSLVWGSFLPVSYRALVMLCGASGMGWGKFLGGLALGRFLRYSVMAVLIFYFRQSFATAFDKILLTGALLLVAGWVLRRLVVSRPRAFPRLQTLSKHFGKGMRDEQSVLAGGD